MDTYQNNYNQPNYNQSNGFAIASLSCGIASLVVCCTGVLSLVFGSLGILFAVLTRRNGRPMPTMSLIGLIISIIGLALGLFLTIYSIILIFTTPMFWEEFDTMFRQMYGIGFEEYMNMMYQ